MKTIRLYRIGLFSMFRVGCGLGLILNFLPAMVFTFLVLWITSQLVRWLAGLRAALPLPGGLSIPVSTIELLGLQGFLRALEGLANLAGWQIAALSVLLWLAGAAVAGLLALVAGAVMNIIAQLAGGLELTVADPADEQLARLIADRRSAALERPSGPAARQLPHGPFFELLGAQKRILPISTTGIILGSEPSAGIVLDGLAPRHAQVIYDRGRYLLIDLGGGNMWVRERPAEQVNLLEDGTLVQLGPWQMIFRAASA